jgi:small basic protein (TIGR04137 family)
MSLHSSLKTKSGALRQHRNVLTRAERIEMLSELERFDGGDDSPLGLVKVGHRKAKAGKKKAKKVEGEAE